MFLLLFSLARILGIELYGEFSYSYAIITGIATVIGEAFSVAFSRYVVFSEGKADYRNFLSLTIWGGIAVGALCVIVLSFFSAPASSYERNAVYLLFAAFILGFACVCNLTFTGLMYTVEASVRWAVALSAHGLTGLLVVIAVASFSRRVEFSLLALGLCTLIAPAIAFQIMKANAAGAGRGLQRRIFSFREMSLTLTHSGVPAVAGSMLLGAPVHIICLMIFANASSSASEVGYFNLFFLFYILVTVLPSALASYVVVRLAGLDGSASRLYLVLGAAASILLPLLMFFSRDLWLCYLGDGLCEKKELLGFALSAGGLGLMTTIMTQVLHSKRMTWIVFSASVVYAVVYLLSTIFASTEGSMFAVGLFRCFVYALIAQMLVLIVLGLRVLLRQMTGNG
ncbi:hypothetical protein [Pseudomonas sp.]|uniref:hypothetical protein n=1 Tax=Pseudomonas sp. TaxID=306 RepID=UPI0028AE132B|nr:hypothetical protein [Pseudomonas sp.]